MARCADPHGSSVRASSRALLTAAIIACCALISQSPAAALAAKSTTTSASAPPSEAPSSAHNRRAERAAGVESAPVPPVAAPLPAPPETLSGARSHRAPPNGAASPAPAPVSAPGANGRHAGAGSGPPPTPAHAHERTNSAHGGAPGATGLRGSSEPSEGVAAAGVTGDGESAQGVEALARAKKGAGGKSGGGKKQKEKPERTKAKGKAKEAETEGESTAPGETETGKQSGVGSAAATSKGDAAAAEAQAASATVDPGLAASVMAPVASASNGTGAASIDAAAPASRSAVHADAGASRKQRRARRAQRDGVGATALGSVFAPAALSPVSSALSDAAPARAAHPTNSSAKRTRAASAQPALVKTITKIVGVVPAPVRILIGALIALALALGLRSLLASIGTRRLVRQRGELLEDVGLLQAALLPEPPARLGPVGTSVAYRPADGPGAGGDFYDAFALADGRLAVIVGDVSGHGREALPHTALVRFTVRAYLEAGVAPADALRTAGAVLERQLAGSFATVIAAIYHPRERTLTYASAGHPPPVVLGAPAPDGSFTPLATVTACSAPPIGAGMRTGTRETVVSVPGAARLCFHTDGVTEARIGAELFGAARLARTLAALEPSAGAVALLDSVAAQSDARPDDMAACLLHVHAGAGAGAPAISRERVELEEGSLARGRVERFLHDSGFEPARAAAIVDAARAELTRASSVTLELRFEGGAPTASVRAESLIQAKPLAVATAS
jgi:serine phosphatase RsbU (regulator of sigma subunit)